MGTLATFYVCGVALSVVTTTLGAVYVWRRSGSIWQRLLLLLVALWSALALGFMLVPSDAVALTLVHLRGTVLAVIAPVAAFAALDWTRKSVSLSVLRLLGLTVIPVVSLVGIWAPWGWVYGELHLVPDVPFRVVQSFEYGLWLPVMTLYSYTVIATAATLLVASEVRSLEPYRPRTPALIAVVVVPMTAQVTAWFLGLLDLPMVDLPAATFWAIVPAWIVLARRFGESGIHPIIRESLLDAMRDAVVVTTPSCIIVETNPAFDWLRERAETEITELVFGDGPPNVHQPAIEGPTRTDSTVKIHGEIRHFELVKTPLGVASGAPGLLTVIRDVTDTVELARRLEAYDEMVAHDLRRPLAEALAAIDRALAAGDTAVEGAIDAARASCRQALQLVNVHLRLARFREGQQYRVKVESDAIIRTVLVQLRTSLDEARIAVMAPHEWPLAAGDPLLVEHLWREVVGLAIRTASSDTRIDVRARREGDDFVRFSVRYRSRTSDPGPALSLLAERILARQGGSHGIDEAEDGRTVWFELPAWT